MSARKPGSGSSGARTKVVPPPGGPPSSGRTPRARRTPATTTDSETPSARRSRENTALLTTVTEETQPAKSTKITPNSRLLEVCNESNSDSSASESPRSDTDGRPDSKEHSIAVDCATSPTEVIVQGKNVKKIRVKFPPHPPHPPPAEEPRYSDSAKNQPRLTHAQSTSHFYEVHPKSEDGIPLSQEESSSPSDSSTLSMPHISGSNPFYGSDSGITRMSSRDLSFPSLNALNTGMGLDMDGKFKQDILHGLEYFDKRNMELKKVNKKVIWEVEKMSEANSVLEDQIDQLHKRYAILTGENDELKIKVDMMEKENMQLQEQAYSEWTGRVKLEEMYMEVKRDSEKELKSFKKLVEEQNKELRNLRKESQRETEKEREKDTKVADDTLELVHKLSQLQDEIRRLNTEKELGHESSKRLQEDLKDLRDLHKQKIAELEAQYKRFLSLKKSFNDLLEQHETLKKQTQGRKDRSGNSTWPSNKTNALPAEIETVHFIDLPASRGQAKSTTSVAGAPYKNNPFQRGTPLLKAPTQAVRGKVHSRTLSDGLCMPDNLPPVANPAK